MSLACPRPRSGYEPSLSPLATCNEQRSDATCTGCNGRNSYLRLLRSGVSCLQGYLESCHRDTLTAKPEFGNVRDPYAVAVVTRRRRSCFSSRGNLMMGVTMMGVAWAAFRVFFREWYIPRFAKFASREKYALYGS